MKTPIALEVEIPEETYVLLTNFIENHAPLGFNEVVSLAVSNFLTNQKTPLNSCQSYLYDLYDYANNSQVLEQ
ncbi:MAG: DUF2811 domain-containing protein [Crocosphaera sp.]|uniref:DUF2811 domain-containing protein n=1 Tax=Crocosphaera sp. TaxID=2729996 RepID=UPI003F23CE2A|nr:DUF2811 domain-containing protein [Crocosphaera sp.]